MLVTVTVPAQGRLEVTRPGWGRVLPGWAAPDTSRGGVTPLARVAMVLVLAWAESCARATENWTGCGEMLSCMGTLLTMIWPGTGPATPPTAPAPPTWLTNCTCWRLPCGLTSCTAAPAAADPAAELLTSCTLLTWWLTTCSWGWLTSCTCWPVLLTSWTGCWLTSCTVCWVPPEPLAATLFWSARATETTWPGWAACCWVLDTTSPVMICDCAVAVVLLLRGGAVRCADRMLWLVCTG